MTNCPNCGAPIIGLVCEYCGTRHYDLPIETHLSYPNKQNRISMLQQQLIMIQTQLSQAAQTNYLLQKKTNDFLQKIGG